jgi:hypothetical protein
MNAALDLLRRGCLVLALGGAVPLAVAQAATGQAERNAIELRQGMTLESVQTLLGKPARTALKHRNARPDEQGSLEWTYTFGGKYSRRVLQVVFAANAPGQWTVESWDWPGY